MKPRLALVLGDPNGIGPELCAKLLANAGNADRAHVVLFSNDAILESGLAVAGVPRNAMMALEMRSMDLIAARDITPGRATEHGGRAALAALRAATIAAREHEVDGIVFAPLNKHALRLAGMNHEDELRFMQEMLGVNGFVTEFNITEGLWTSRVTSHIPLAEVSANVTRERILHAVEIVHRYLAASGKQKPRIAVAGLNPHAGDGGSIGREEIDVIAPAVQDVRARGVDATGPLSPDTVFVLARRGDFDAVVSMYHDQGQIAMKLLGFDGGVTLHGGLPVPVATCASGTAFDIVGRNVASVHGLQHAFDLAAAIAGSAATARP